MLLQDASKMKPKISSLLNQQTVSKKEAPLSSGLIFFASIIYALLFIRDIAGGALRYYADIYGAKILWFFPDALCGLGFVVFSLRLVNRNKSGASILIFLWLVYSALGLFMTQSSLSVFSAAKMICPLFLGLCLGEFRETLLSRKKLSFFFFAVAVTGIFLSQDIRFPWVGYTTSAFGIARTATAETWFGYNEVRLAGFAARNSSAACVVMLSAILLLKNMRPLFSVLIASAAFYAIYLTTGRTSGVALFVFCFMLLIHKLGLKRLFRFMFVSFSSLFYLSPFVIPLLTLGIERTDVPSWAASLIDRAKEVWVAPYSFIFENFPVGFITGLGLGSVAFPADFSKSLRLAFNFTDNFMFANYLMFGVVAIVVTPILIKGSFKKLNINDKAIFIALIVYGTTLDGYGTSIFGFLMGLLASPYGGINDCVASSDRSRKAHRFLNNCKNV